MMHRNNASASELCGRVSNCVRARGGEIAQTFPDPVLPTLTALQHIENHSGKYNRNIPTPIRSPELILKEMS